jgi:hypothetical protein
MSRKKTCFAQYVYLGYSLEYMENKKQYVLSGSGVDGRQDGDSQCDRDAEEVEKCLCKDQKDCS